MPPFTSEVLFLAINTTVKATILLTLAALVVLLSRRASASFRHLVWALGLGCVLFLPLLSQALPHWRVTVKPPAAHPPPPVALSPLPAPSVSPASPRSNGPLDETIPSSALPVPLSPMTETPLSTPKQPALARPAVAINLPWTAWAFLAWAAGVLLVLMRLTRGGMRLRAVALAGVPVTDAPHSEALAAAKRAMGVGRPVALLSASAGVTVPVTWGALRPIVVLPAEAAAWSEDKLRAALLHELAHVRRGDWLLQTLAYFACALYWFNPLVWLAAQRMRAESETACDDLVLAAGVPAKDYARHLLDVALRARDGRQFGVGAVAMAQTPKIEGRLRTVLATGLSRGTVRGRVAAGALAAAVLLVVPMAALRLQAGTPKTPVPDADRLQLHDGFTLRYAATITDLRSRQGLYAEYRRMHDSYQQSLKKYPHFQPVPEEAVRPFSYYLSRRPKTRHLILTVSAEAGRLLYRSEEKTDTYTYSYNGSGTQLFWNGHTGRTDPGLTFAEMEDCPLPAVGLPHVPLLKRTTLVHISGTQQTWSAQCPVEGAEVQQGMLLYSHGLVRVVGDGKTWKILNVDSPEQQLQFLQHQRFQGLWIASRMRLTKYEATSIPSGTPFPNSLEETSHFLDTWRTPTSMCEYRLLSASDAPLDAASFDPIAVKRSAIQALYQAGIKRNILHWPSAWHPDAKTFRLSTQIQKLMVHDHTAQATVQQDDQVTATDPQTEQRHIIASRATFDDFWRLGPKGWTLQQGRPQVLTETIDGKTSTAQKEIPKMSRNKLTAFVGAGLIAAGGAMTPARAQIVLPRPILTAEMAGQKVPGLTGEITHLRIVGNAHLSTKTIQRLLPQREGHVYDPALAEKDRQAIRESGYFSSVTLATTAEPSGGVDETYTVTENPVVARIVFTSTVAGSSLPIASDTLKARMSFKEGQVLNTRTLMHDLDTLFNHNTGYVHSRGFILDADSGINVNPTTGVLTIPLEDRTKPSQSASGGGPPVLARLAAIGLPPQNADGSPLRTRQDYAVWLERLLPLMQNGVNSDEQALQQDIRQKLSQHPAQVNDLLQLLRTYGLELRSAHHDPAVAVQWLTQLQPKATSSAEGIPELRRAVQSDPNNVAAQAQLAIVLYAVYERQSHFTRFGTLKPGPPAVLDEAIQHMKMAVAREPESALGQAMLGFWLAQRHRWIESVPHLRRARELADAASSVRVIRYAVANGNNPNGQANYTLYALCDSFVRHGEYKEAALHYTQAFLAAQGDLYAARGQYHEAQERYQKALQFDPFTTYVLSAQAEVLMHQGRRAEARTVWKQVLSIDPPQTFYYEQARAFLTKNPSLT